MSNERLSLNLFVEKQKLYHSDKFSDGDVFSYLGKGLESWLAKILTAHGVKDQPVIKGQVASGAYIQGAVYIAEGAVVEPTAYIMGPCYIGPDTEVRHGAYLRGNVYVGKGCVVGHTTEVKGSVFLDGAKAGHFAYVGDSILGREVNLGAGTKLANLKIKADEVKFKHPTSHQRVASGLRKFGAIMGDFSQTGCNAVLSPGTLLLPNTAVMSCEHFHGTLEKGVYVS